MGQWDHCNQTRPYHSTSVSKPGLALLPLVYNKFLIEVHQSLFQQYFFYNSRVISHEGQDPKNFCQGNQSGVVRNLEIIYAESMPCPRTPTGEPHTHGSPHIKIDVPSALAPPSSSFR